MNYEQKYKQALERARKELQEFKNKDCDDTTRRTAINIIRNLFTELKVSEEERIRKEIVDFITASNKYGTNESCEAWLNWLEKQGNRKMLDADEVIAWLEDQACLGWIEDVEVHIFVDKFKKDFGL